LPRSASLRRWAGFRGGAQDAAIALAVAAWTITRCWKRARGIEAAERLQAQEASSEMYFTMKPISSMWPGQHHLAARLAPGAALDADQIAEGVDRDLVADPSSSGPTIARRRSS
jgi:hypothetical protein